MALDLQEDPVRGMVVPNLTEVQRNACSPIATGSLNGAFGCAITTTHRDVRRHRSLKPTPLAADGH